MSLETEIQRISDRHALPVSQVKRTLVDAIADAAHQTWGGTFEAELDAQTGQVLLHQVVQVVDRVENPREQVAIADAGGAEVGDALLHRVYFLDEDAALARSDANPATPSVDALASGLPAPDSPTWLSSLWPRRRQPWRWGRPVDVPALPDALDILERWMHEHVPSFAPGPAPDLETLSSLGEAADDFVRVSERFGATGLEIFGAALRTPAEAIRERDMMNMLLRQGVWNDQPGWWSSGWLPAFGGTGYCVDLDAAKGGQPGQLVRWLEDAPEREVVAPSLGAWIGVVALGLHSELLPGSPHGIQAPRPDRAAAWDELRSHALAGFPRRLH